MCVRIRAPRRAASRNLTKELGPRGITVNAIAPGVIATEMNAWVLASDEIRDQAAASSPFNRLGEARDMADLIAIVVSDDARWMTGQWIDASGGALL